MQINSVDPAVKAGAIGVAAGAAVSTGLNVYGQRNIIQNPDTFTKAVAPIKDMAKDLGAETKDLDRLVKVAETGKYDVKLIAKNAGKTGVLLGGLFALGNVAYRAITNKAE